MFGGIFVLLLAWSLANPMFAAPDEDLHLARSQTGVLSCLLPPSCRRSSCWRRALFACRRTGYFVERAIVVACGSPEGTFSDKATNTSGLGGYSLEYAQNKVK